MEENTMRFRASYNVEVEQLNDLFDTLKQSAQNFEIYQINDKLYLYMDGNFDVLEGIDTPLEERESPKPFNAKISEFKEFFVNSNGYQVRKCGLIWDYCDGNCDNCEKAKVSYVTTDDIKENHYPSTTDHTTYNKPFSMVSEDFYTGTYLESDEFGTRICNSKTVYCNANCDECTIDFN